MLRARRAFAIIPAMNAYEVFTLAFSSAAFAVSVVNVLYVRRTVKAAERSADAAARAVEHQIEREQPKGVVSRRRSSFGETSVLVANTGHVPFTVVEVGLGDVPFEYSFGESAGRGSARIVMSGDSATFPGPRGFDGSGLAYAVVADGTVLQEDAPCR